MSQNNFFPQPRDLRSTKKLCKDTFFHLLSPVIFATATVVTFVLLCNYRFNFHCYTRCEAMPTEKLAQKWCCDLSWHLVQKITKGIHSCKPASLNCPINSFRFMHPAPDSATQNQTYSSWALFILRNGYPILHWTRLVSKEWRWGSNLRVLETRALTLLVLVFQLTGDFAWMKPAKDNVLAQCEMQLNRQVSDWVVNPNTTLPGPSEAYTDQFCIADCGGAGTCVKGK